MNFEKHFKIAPDKLEKISDSLKEVEKQALENFTTPEAGELLLDDVLHLFHEAYNADGKRFLKEIFFENQVALRLIRDHEEEIFSKVDALKASTEEMNRRGQIQLVNLYRNIVADLFDPYLSIIVACLKLKESKFESFLQANLSQTEFQKFEYASSRLKGSTIFNGYDPLIRNAVSHSGTDSILYENDGIIFKKIKRSTEPEIGSVLKIKNEQLINYVYSMIDFIVAVGTAINIFGLDAVDLITDDQEMSGYYVQRVADQDAIERLRERKITFYDKVWNDPTLTNPEKLEHFSKEFAKHCQQRKLPATNIVFKKKEGMVIIEVPLKQIDMASEQAVIDRAVELIKYALIAEPLFGQRYKSFLVLELADKSYNRLQVWLQGDDLKAFDLRKANIYDLLYDGNIYKNEVDLDIRVDFEALEEIQHRSFNKVRTGRKRK